MLERYTSQRSLTTLFSFCHKARVRLVLVHFYEDVYSKLNTVYYKFRFSFMCYYTFWRAEIVVAPNANQGDCHTENCNKRISLPKQAPPVPSSELICHFGQIQRGEPCRREKVRSRDCGAEAARMRFSMTNHVLAWRVLPSSRFNSTSSQPPRHNIGVPIDNSHLCASSSGYGILSFREGALYAGGEASN